MLSALEIAAQGFAPVVARLVALQGFGDAVAGGGGGYGGGTGRAGRRYVVRRRNVLMSFANKADADRMAEQVAAEVAASRQSARRPKAVPVQVVDAPEFTPIQLPDALDLSAVASLAAEQGMRAAFDAAMQAQQYAVLVTLYLRSLEAQEEDDIEVLVLSMH